MKFGSRLGGALNSLCSLCRIRESRYGIFILIIAISSNSSVYYYRPNEMLTRPTYAVSGRVKRSTAYTRSISDFCTALRLWTCMGGQ